MSSGARTWDELRGRRVLVTGASGFIGSNLVRRLQHAGAEVHLVMRSESSTWRLPKEFTHTRLHRADFWDKPFLSRVFDDAVPDVVFHLATPRGTDAEAWSRLADFNVRVAMHLVEQLRRSPATPLVVAGSALEYGPRNRPHREDDALRPATWHGIAKAAAGMIYTQAASSLGLSISQLRIFHVYGPWEASHRLLPSAIRAALSGRALPLTAGISRRDWVYVGDVVEAMFLASIGDPPSGCWNIGSGSEYTNDEVLAVVERLTGRTIERERGAYPDGVFDTEHRCADIRKSRELLKWSPQHNLEGGVAAMLDWYEAHPRVWEEVPGRPLHV